MGIKNVYFLVFICPLFVKKNSNFRPKKMGPPKKGICPTFINPFTHGGGGHCINKSKKLVLPRPSQSTLKYGSKNRPWVNHNFDIQLGMHIWVYRKSLKSLLMDQS